jgi:hypothetical protein
MFIGSMNPFIKMILIINIFKDEITVKALEKMEISFLDQKDKYNPIK